MPRRISSFCEYVIIGIFICLIGSNGQVHYGRLFIINWLTNITGFSKWAQNIIGGLNFGGQSNLSVRIYCRSSSSGSSDAKELRKKDSVEAALKSPESDTNVFRTDKLQTMLEKMNTFKKSCLYISPPDPCDQRPGIIIFFSDPDNTTLKSIPKVRALQFFIVLNDTRGKPEGYTNTETVDNNFVIYSSSTINALAKRLKNFISKVSKSCLRSIYSCKRPQKICKKVGGPLAILINGTANKEIEGTQNCDSDSALKYCTVPECWWFSMLDVKCWSILKDIDWNRPRGACEDKAKELCWDYITREFLIRRDDNDIRHACSIDITTTPRVCPTQGEANVTREPEGVLEVCASKLAMNSSGILPLICTEPVLKQIFGGDWVTAEGWVVKSGNVSLFCRKLDHMLGVRSSEVLGTSPTSGTDACINVTRSCSRAVSKGYNPSDVSGSLRRLCSRTRMVNICSKLAYIGTKGLDLACGEWFFRKAIIKFIKGPIDQQSTKFIEESATNPSQDPAAEEDKCCIDSRVVLMGAVPLLILVEVALILVSWFVYRRWVGRRGRKPPLGLTRSKSKTAKIIYDQGPGMPQGPYDSRPSTTSLGPYLSWRDLRHPLPKNIEAIVLPEEKLPTMQVPFGLGLPKVERPTFMDTPRVVTSGTRIDENVYEYIGPLKKDAVHVSSNMLKEILDRPLFKAAK